MENTEEKSKKEITEIKNEALFEKAITPEKSEQIELDALDTESLPSKFEVTKIEQQVVSEPITADEAASDIIAEQVNSN